MSSFDTISHDRLMRFLEHRIGDQRVLRLIGKWLKAGVLEDGTWTEGTVGTPQGAVISPLLANVYLHYVYDLWVQQWRNRHSQGDMIVVRGACPCEGGGGRHDRRLPARGGCPPLPRRPARKAGEVRAGPASRENPSDPVRSIRESQSTGRGARRAGDF